MLLDYKTKIRLFAAAISLPVILLAAIAVSVPEYQFMVAHGPIQKGHADVDCSGCHVSAAGSTRQQIQAGVKFAIGLRETGADFGFAQVTSETCIACHERPNDRHPIYRFNEPRFEDAILEIAATSCLGCHTEHVDARASPNITFCAHCHEDLALKKDPIDVPHVELVRADEWQSCLGCHDFHGNFGHEPQLLIDEAFAASTIEDYLKSGPSPYGNDKIYKATNQ